MVGTEYRFEVGDRVKLRDGVHPGLYAGMARVGNEGVISARRKDYLGLPEVYIQWDRNHWAFNQQPDGWTYQEHFDPVEEKPVSQDPNLGDVIRAELMQAADRIAGAITPSVPEVSASEANPGIPEEVVESLAQIDSASKARAYMESIQEAVQLLPDSESFILITVTRQDDPRALQGALHCGMVGNSLSPETEALLGVRLSEMAANFHKEVATLQIYRFAEEKDKAEGQ